jgi:hypothetical protein
MPHTKEFVVVQRTPQGAPPTFVGCDPGAQGAIVYFTSTGVVCVPLAGKTDYEIWAEVLLIPKGSVVVIERNTGYVGGAGNPGASMFKFGVSTGNLLGFFVAAGLRVDKVTPRVWQKALGIAARAKTESKADFKRRLRQRAEQAFGRPVALATADAYLIALFCQRKWGNNGSQS